MNNQEFENLRFLNFREYEKIQCSLQSNYHDFVNWIKFHRIHLSPIYSLSQQQINNMQQHHSGLLSTIKSSIKTKTHLQCFMQVVYQLSNLQLSQTPKIIIKIQHQYQSILKEHKKKLQDISNQIQDVIQEFHRSVNCPIQCLNTCEIIQTQLYQIFQTKNNQTQLKFYQEQNWNQRINIAEQLLNGIETSRKSLNAQNQETIIFIERLYKEVVKYRDQIIHYRTELFIRYTKASRKISKTIQQRSKQYENILSRYKVNKNTVQNSPLTKNELQKYMQGLETLKNIYHIQACFRETKIKKIQKIFVNKDKQIQNFESRVSAIEEYYEINEKIIQNVNDTIKRVESNSSKAQYFINQLFVKMGQVYLSIIKKFQETQSKISWIKDRTVIISKFQIFEVDAPQHFKWLWHTNKSQGQGNMKILKEESNAFLNKIQKQANLYKQLATKMLLKGQHHKKYIIDSKCQLYSPITMQKCHIKLDENRIVLKNDNSKIIIPQATVIKVTTHDDHKKMHIKLINGLKIKIRQINFHKCIENIENILNSRIGSPCEALSFVKSKQNHENTEQKIQKYNQQSVFSHNTKDSESTKQVTQQSEDVIINKQIGKLSDFKKYHEFEIQNCSLQDTYKAIFTDETPFFADNKFSTFFDYMSNYVGDKDFKASKYDQPGPQAITGNPNPNNHPKFSTRTAYMIHPLPKVPLIPSFSTLNETSKIFWLSDKHIIYSAKVQLSGASMFQGVVTRTVFKVRQIQENTIKVQIFGNFSIEGKNSFKGILKKAAEQDMKKVMNKYSQQFKLIISKYTNMHKKVK